jgi:hypothetical protein
MVDTTAATINEDITVNMDTNTEDTIKENITGNMDTNMVDTIKANITGNEYKKNVVFHLTDIVKHSMMSIAHDLMLMFDDP